VLTDRFDAPIRRRPWIAGLPNVVDAVERPLARRE